MESKDKILNLYACCIPVKGNRRSIICDVQRRNYYLIPNALFEVLTTFSNHSIEDLSTLFKDDFEVILEYMDFIQEHDMGHLIDKEEAALFPQIELSWLKPEAITNAILDFGANLALLPLKDVAEELDVLACKALQLRFYHEIDTTELLDVLNAFNESRLRHFDIVMKYNPANSNADILSVINSFERISFITVYQSPDLDVIDGDNEVGLLHFVQHGIPSHLACGNISRDEFSLNLGTITESLHHNSCLNRKISIDVDGNIKNCPSMSQSFGNIKDTTLQEALDHPDFKKYWNVTKDQISVCKDCEFRYICTDCRGYIENPEDMYSKPLKCGYNPYTCEWEEWSTNPLKQKAIDYYGMREVLPEFKMKPDYVPETNLSTL